ncbi:hypothetical protein Tco_0979489 [Tanacetum coccineum]
MRKLLQDVQNISEELAEYINSPSWNRLGNMMTKNTQEALIIIERKAIVRTYRNKYVQEEQAANLAVQKEQEEQAAQRDEHLCTIPEKKSDEFIKSSVEDLVPIPSESEDASDNENECDVLVCDDSSPLDVLEDNPVIFSNPLFNSNKDFTSSEDELLSEENVPKETFKIYSNPLFEFDDDFTSSDVNPLFNEVLEDVESEDSFDSKLAEPTLLISPLSDANKDECFDPGAMRSMLL